MRETGEQWLGPCGNPSEIRPLQPSLQVSKGGGKADQSGSSDSEGSDSKDGTQEHQRR